MRQITVQRTALISECGGYRYHLTRQWAPSALLNFVMLNPSKADAHQDDPTIVRCIRRARALGFGGIVVTNLFALRSTDPSVLPKHGSPVGPENDRYLLEAAKSAEMVICAWGMDGRLQGRSEEVSELLLGSGLTLHALKLSRDGQPFHPLYLPYSLVPQVWRKAA